jgi:hypothetical protein
MIWGCGSGRWTPSPRWARRAAIQAALVRPQGRSADNGLVGRLRRGSPQPGQPDCTTLRCGPGDPPKGRPALRRLGRSVRLAALPQASRPARQIGLRPVLPQWRRVALAGRGLCDRAAAARPRRLALFDAGLAADLEFKEAVLAGDAEAPPARSSGSAAGKSGYLAI